MVSIFSLIICACTCAPNFNKGSINRHMREGAPLNNEIVAQRIVKLIKHLDLSESESPQHSSSKWGVTISSVGTTKYRGLKCHVMDCYVRNSDTNWKMSFKVRDNRILSYKYLQTLLSSWEENYIMYESEWIDILSVDRLTDKN